MHSATCQAFSVASLNPVERADRVGRHGGGRPAAPRRRLAAPARGDMARTVRRAIGIRERAGPDRQRPGRGLPAARRDGAEDPRRPARHVDRRRHRAPAPDAAPARHGGRGGALQLSGGPAGPPAPDGVLRRHDDLRHGGPGRGGHRPGAAGPPPRQGHRPRRAALLGRRPRAGDLHPRGRGGQLPGLVTALRAPALDPRRVRPLLRGGGAGGAGTRGDLGPALVGRGGELPPAAAARALRRSAGQSGPGLAPAWRGPAAERARRLLASWWRPPSASCRGGPAGSSGSPSPDRSTCSSTPRRSRR